MSGTIQYIVRNQKHGDYIYPAPRMVLVSTFLFRTHYFLFASYYVYHLQYPSQVKNIVYFMQDFMVRHPNSYDHSGTYLATSSDVECNYQSCSQCTSIVFNPLFYFNRFSSQYISSHCLQFVDCSSPFLVIIANHLAVVIICIDYCIASIWIVLTYVWGSFNLHKQLRQSTSSVVIVTIWLP